METFVPNQWNTRTLSCFSKVGTVAELAHVNLRPDNTSSLRLRDSMQALNSAGHLPLNLLLFF
jgi:hypothetical protein